MLSKFRVELVNKSGNKQLYEDLEEGIGKDLW